MRCAQARSARARHSTPVSRESLLLANNVLLVVACASVLLGTLYPLCIDALGVGKISVGPPYFDAVFFALTAPLVFLMAIGPVASWRRALLPDLWTRLRWALAVAIVTACLLPFVMGTLAPDGRGRPLPRDMDRRVDGGRGRCSACVHTGACAATPRPGTAWCSRTSASRCSSSA